MNPYRIFLLRREKITAHHEFSAENDASARRAAALAFDACADHCDDFELWYGAHLVGSAAGLRTRDSNGPADAAAAEADAAAGDAAIAATAVTIIEAVMATSAALRDSPRLRLRLNALRGRAARPRS
jgi:hypothetical protein